MIPSKEHASAVLDAADVLIRSGMLPRKAGEALLAKLLAAHKNGPAVDKVHDELAGHACRSVACAIGLGHLSNGADPKAVRERLADLVDMSEHAENDDHEGVLTKTLLSALAGKSKPVIIVVQSGGDDAEPSGKANIPLDRVGRPTEADVREFKRRHKR